MLREHAVSFSFHEGKKEISAANVILFDVFVIQHPGRILLTLIHSPVYRIFRFPNTYTLIHVAATFDKASSVAI